MDFPFNINAFLPEEITKIDSKFQVCRQAGRDRYGFQELQRMLFEVVEKMGDASAKAQKLSATITTGKKLEHSNHRLYVMKDSSGERSCVVGFLKVGEKKLFVYDSTKVQHEVEPLCVLDFYVHESRQRMGCGKKLFDFMLMCENIPVQHFAIDRPSPKFLSFLKKHYRLHAYIPQVNNYVVFDGFFHRRQDLRNGRNRSNMANSNSSQPSSGRNLQLPSTPQHPNSHSNGNYSGYDSFSKKRQSPSNMAAAEHMYSRHRATPPSRRATPTFNHDPSHKSPETRGMSNYNLTNGRENQMSHVSSQNSSNQNYNFNASVNRDAHETQNFPQSDTKPLDINHNKISSPYMQYSMGKNMPQPINNVAKPANSVELQDPQNQPLTAYPTNPKESQNISPQGANSRSAIAAVTLPEIRSANSSHRADNDQQSDYNSLLPPGGKRNKFSDPPLLQRNGPPAEYKAMMNLHQTYQGRNGRFVVPSDTKTVEGPMRTASQTTNHPHWTSPYGQRSGAPNNSDWNWSMSGHLRDQRMKQNLSSKYNPGRLW